MKTPTTGYSIDLQSKITINRDFLEKRGWVLTEEKPLYEDFKYKNNADLICSITLYGGFSITELDWINKTPTNQFSAMNPNLTEEDYHSIIRMLWPGKKMN